MECQAVAALEENMSAELEDCREGDEEGEGGCRIVEVEMDVEGLADRGIREERLASELAAEAGEDAAQLPFSKELITFSLFGKMPAKLSELLIRQ